MGFVPLCSGQLTTNRVEKVADFAAYIDAFGVIHGCYNPNASATLVGSNLWFTTLGGST